MKYRTIILDADSLDHGLSGENPADSVIGFHRFLGLVRSRYLDVQKATPVAGMIDATPAGSEIMICCDGENDIVTASRNLGLPIVSGGRVSDLIRVCVERCKGTALIVSDDHGAVAHLSDSPDPVHILSGVGGAHRILTLAALVRAGGDKPARCDCSPVGVSISRSDPDLRAHRWWLVAVGAESALRPDGWAQIEGLIG